MPCTVPSLCAQEAKVEKVSLTRSLEEERRLFEQEVIARVQMQVDEVGFRRTLSC